MILQAQGIRHEESLWGPNDSGAAAEGASALSSVNVDVCFISTGTWDVQDGVTTLSTDKVVLKRAALSAASTRVLLAESTTFGTFGRFNVVPLAKLDAVVTDSEFAKPARAAVTDRGIEVHIASI